MAPPPRSERGLVCTQLSLAEGKGGTHVGAPSQAWLAFSRARRALSRKWARPVG